MTLPSEHLEVAPAVTDVIRMVPLPNARLEARAGDGDGDGRTLVGYASVFNQWTEIDSFWEGRFLEQIDPGAFQNTLAKRGDRVKVLFNHGFDPQIGDKPLGKPARMEPDDVGLWTETPLARTSFNDDLIELLRIGAIDGQSFRFKVTEETWKDDPDPSDDNPKSLPERTILALDLYEFGPVTFPAYEATTAGVRSADVYRAWRQNPQGLLTPLAGPKGTEDPPADSRPPGHLSPAERAAEVSRRIDRLRVDKIQRRTNHGS